MKGVLPDEDSTGHFLFLSADKNRPAGRLLFLLLTVLLLPCSGHSQSDSGKSSTKIDSLAQQVYSGSDTVPQKDIGDVARQLLHHQPKPDKPHKPGKKYYAFAPGLDYDPSTGGILTFSGSVVWQTKNPQNHNVSIVYPAVAITQKNQKLFSLFSSIWTSHHFTLQGNAWYMQYPEYTFGLGSRTTNEKKNLLDYRYVRFYQSVLRQLFPNAYAGVGYRLDDHYRITEKGNKDNTVSDFYKYGLHRSSISSGPSFEYLYDTRQNAINPPRGTFANVVYSPKLKAWGSDNNWQQLQIDLRKYVPLSRFGNVLAFWYWSTFTLKGVPPYLDLPSVGWDNLQRSGRGYDQSRYRGRNMVYFEMEDRFSITRNGLFGGVLFANAESFSEMHTNRFQTILPAAGAGLRIKFDKHSNSNVCIDYGVGAHGSHGLYINVGETF